MTQLLEKAIEQIRNLGPDEQDAIATIILDEMADERAWDEQFARSQDALARLAGRVREDIRVGRVRVL